jgi:hypothetical protein
LRRMAQGALREILLQTPAFADLQPDLANVLPAWQIAVTLLGMGVDRKGRIATSPGSGHPLNQLHVVTTPYTLALRLAVLRQPASRQK